MNHEERGPGLLGDVRWELYCFGMDPNLATNERVVVACSAAGHAIENAAAPIDSVATPEFALRIARMIRETERRDPPPMRLHLFSQGQR